MQRAILSFSVPVQLIIRGQATRRFLAADGSLVDNEDTAVRFRLHRSPTMREHNQIESLEHEYHGGLRRYLDIVDGAEKTRRRLVADIVRTLWPTGRPEVTGEAYAEQEKAIAEAWVACDTIERSGWETMVQKIDRLHFMAVWAVLIVGAPDGWASLYERELDTPVFMSIWNAYVEAMEEANAGKPPPSAS